MSELRECRLCGYPAITFDSLDHKRWYAGCINRLCFAWANNQTRDFKTQEAAIKAWNHRAPVNPPDDIELMQRAFKLGKQHGGEISDVLEALSDQVELWASDSYFWETKARELGYEEEVTE